MGDKFAVYEWDGGKLKGVETTLGKAKSLYKKVAKDYDGMARLLQIPNGKKVPEQLKGGDDVEKYGFKYINGGGMKDVKRIITKAKRILAKAVDPISNITKVAKLTKWNGSYNGWDLKDKKYRSLEDSIIGIVWDEDEDVPRVDDATEGGSSNKEPKEIKQLKAKMDKLLSDDAIKNWPQIEKMLQKANDLRLEYYKTKGII